MQRPKGLQALDIVRKKDRASCFVGVADGGAGNDLGMLGSVAGEAARTPEMRFP
ncbi:hypothetical protein N9F34_04695 [Alphaproteobacteria bacterium]|nr:hypothetical protein [Alphaproteobacteria bacterium]